LVGFLVKGLGVAEERVEQFGDAAGEPAVDDDRVAAAAEVFGDQAVVFADRFVGSVGPDGRCKRYLGTAWRRRGMQALRKPKRYLPSCGLVVAALLAGNRCRFHGVISV